MAYIPQATRPAQWKFPCTQSIDKHEPFYNKQSLFASKHNVLLAYCIHSFKLSFYPSSSCCHYKLLEKHVQQQFSSQSNLNQNDLLFPFQSRTGIRKKHFTQYLLSYLDQRYEAEALDSKKYVGVVFRFPGLLLTEIYSHQSVSFHNCLV